jgi:hypothetical protein
MLDGMKRPKRLVGNARWVLPTAPLLIGWLSPARGDGTPRVKISYLRCTDRRPVTSLREQDEHR